MTTRALIAATSLVAAGAVALLGGVLRDLLPAKASGAPTEMPDAFQPAYSSAPNASSLVARLQQTVRSDPDDGRSYALLGLAYQQRARETGNPSYYGKSEKALARALSLDRNDTVALSGLASLALARHRFRQALALARRARSLSPATARNYGAIGDALVELGRYREAFRAFETMARLKPGLASYARVSYARELRGDRAGAVAAMRLAADSAAPATEAAAWTHVQLGKLSFAGGEYGKAAAEYRAALLHLPGYPPALHALAQAQAARGRLREAISLSRRAAAAAPLPEHVALLGDLYRAVGRERAARRQYALIGAIDRLLRANGVRTDLELALFQLDHGIRLADALRRARLAHRDRPSIGADDVLAWALYRNRRCAQALRYSQRALRLGTLDALAFFHRGMIERCLGRDGSAKRWLRQALELNPGFSVLWAPVARGYAG